MLEECVLLRPLPARNEVFGTRRELSAQVRFDGDPARAAARAAEFAAEGAELAVVHLPLPCTSHVLEPLADAPAKGVGGLSG